MDYKIEIVNLRNVRDTTLDTLELRGIDRVDRTTILGNPYVMRTEADRDTVCELYNRELMDRFNTEPLFRKRIHMLVSKIQRTGELKLGCWCAPKRCHAESLRDLIFTILTAEGCPDEIE